MGDIFLSYARADRESAERLAAELEASGYSVWWDRHIDGGSEFAAEIEHRLEEAQVVLVLWSKDGVTSRWVRDEAVIGLEAGKLVATSIDGTPPPIGFKQIHAIDMTDQNGHGDLLRALGHRLGSLPAASSADQAAPSRSLVGIFAAFGAVLLLAGLGAWWFAGGSSDSAEEVTEDELTSVAVLPFRSLSQDEEDRYFAEGVAKEILNRLGALSELRVTARTASFRFADTDQPANSVGETLGVEYFVEGTVRRSGEDWRVTAQLVRAEDGSQLWSDTYDVTGSDILRVQSEIAERAAEALGVLLDDEKRERMGEAGIDNPEAYALFARGLELFGTEHNRGATYENLAEANSYFDRAFELEPRFWNAQLAAIDRYSHLLTDHSIGFPVGGPEVAEEARLEIQRRLSEARQHAPRSAYPTIDQQAIQYSNDWSNAREVVKRMLTEDQSCAVSTSYNDWLVIRLGLMEEYIDYSRRLQRCDPFSSKTPLAAILLYMDRADEALEVIEASGDRSEAMLRIHVLALIAADRIEEAREVLGRMDPQAYYHGQALTWILAAEGDREGLQAQLDSYERLGAPDVAKLHVATLMGNRELANSYAAKIDARPAGPIWFANSGIVTCHCGNGFDLDVTPRFKARLVEAGASLDLPSPVDWPLQK
ncbi:TIR domain-containing protein [Qipengyuania gelatinilytica]|uniref:TIR domain-containing protein n=1 Tax=Qipengyuania gelatinilytica TaxID=2867231 RepID=A0ABX9A4A3_9SPHN|nr:TIR domain-containing protein [Qipengyuania gelatinilytica]QZD96096.1 TIR domain-containing protein [Qipengyuania gelatinilytica]